MAMEGQDMYGEYGDYGDEDYYDEGYSMS